MSADLDRGRRLARRRFARASFVFLYVYAVVVVATLLWDDDRKEIAAALATASGAIAAAVTPLTLILLGYLGVSLAEKIFGKDG